jgi:pyruvate carboxylase subunit B
MVLGYFGKTPVPPDAEVVKAASEQLKLQPTKDHLAAIESGQEARRRRDARDCWRRKALPVTDENLFIVASCEEKGVAFLKGNGTIGVRKNQPKVEAAPAPKPATTTAAPTGRPTAYNIALNGRNYRVVLDGKNALVNGTSYAVDVTEAAAEAAAPAPTTSTGVGQPLVTQLPGLVLRIEKPAGARVKAGEAVLVIESMKMENAIVSPVEGTVAEIQVKQGDQVQAGQSLALVR